ncbi:MAG: MacB-like periplasmic core domain containing protein [candidate division NC10 bacterium]|jgi:putative ABC transport system permease protein|nr:MacB-like periplasmic core domain containing protein [candidate division NC10 bacterium]
MHVLKGSRIALKAVTAHKLRALLAIVGIVVGVAAVIVMLAVGEGAKREVLGKIQGLGTNILIVSAGQLKNVAGRPQLVGNVTTLDLRDTRAISEECPAVARVAPIQSRKLAVKFGTGTTNTSVVGTSADFPAVREFRTIVGRFFDADEVQGAQRVAVVGQTVLTNLGVARNLMGETLRINNVPFEVIGVLEPKGVNYAGIDEDDQVLIPISTALRRLFNLTFLSSLYIQAKDERAMGTAARQVAQLLRERHRIKAGQPEDFTLQTQTEILDAARETSQTFSLLLASIAGVSLFVGGIGILAMMVISVRERTREIGVRRAVGARRRDILLQFILEATTLSLAGGVVGSLVGIAGGVLFARATGWPTAISPVAILIAFGVSAAIGIFFGAYPARRAARLDPIVALRAD